MISYDNVVNLKFCIIYIITLRDYRRTLGLSRQQKLLEYNVPFCHESCLYRCTGIEITTQTRNFRQLRNLP